jgi:hypothetical protein
MHKKNNYRNFSNIETRRVIILNRNSSADDIEKFDRQVSAKASLRSSDLREYWQSGIDRNHYLDEPSAKELNEANHYIPTPSDYVSMLNQSRSSAEKAASYSDLTEVEKMMFKSQSEIKNAVKREVFTKHAVRHSEMTMHG